MPDSITAENGKTEITCRLVDAQEKVQETLSRIINEGSGGMICILL